MRRRTVSRKAIAASVQNRRGLSLLEIIISVAIFMASLAAIMEGLQIGRRPPFPLPPPPGLTVAKTSILTVIELLKATPSLIR